jgi:hypothetical protein
LKLDFGGLVVDLPDGVYLPTMLAGVGREDTGESLALGPTVKKPTPQAFRRTLSVSQLPIVTPDPEQLMKDEVEKFSATTKAKPVTVTERMVCGVKAKIMEAKMPGPGNIPLVTFGCVVYTNGWLFTLHLTALDGKSVGEVRQSFSTLVDRLAPGSLNARK